VRVAPLLLLRNMQTKTESGKKGGALTYHDGQTEQEIRPAPSYQNMAYIDSKKNISGI